MGRLDCESECSHSEDTQCLSQIVADLVILSFDDYMNFCISL